MMLTYMGSNFEKKNPPLTKSGLIKPSPKRSEYRKTIVINPSLHMTGYHKLNDFPINR